MESCSDESDCMRQQCWLVLEAELVLPELIALILTLVVALIGIETHVDHFRGHVESHSVCF